MTIISLRYKCWHTYTFFPPLQILKVRLIIGSLIQQAAIIWAFAHHLIACSNLPVPSYLTLTSVANIQVNLEQ